MPNMATLLAFMGASLLLAISPGPSMVHVISSSVRQGRFAGFVSTLGSTVGRIINTFAVAFGLSAVLLAVPFAFEVIKLTGAVYLIYLGVKTIIKKTETDSEAVGRRPLVTIFYQSLFTYLINPKAALFFLAFLPQFVDQTRGPVFWQIIVLGFVLNIINTLVYLFITFMSSFASRRLKSSRPFVTMQRWITGGVFILFGTTLALAEKH